MNELIAVIKFCGDLITNTYLTFGQYHFSILEIFVSLAAIVIVGYGINKIFSH